MGFQKSIISGLADTEVSPLAVTCPTGNCTWPVVPSLAICGSCSNVPYTTSCVSASGIFENSSEPYHGICTYTADSGAEAVVYEQENGFAGPAFTIQSLNGAAIEERSLNDSVLYLSVLNLIGYQYTGNSSAEVRIHSSQCLFSWCVEAYSISVINGNQTQETIATVDTLNINGNMSSLPVNHNQTFGALPLEMNPPPGTEYTIWFGSYLTMQSYVIPALNGTLVFDQGELEASTSTILTFLWIASADISVMAKSLSTSLTNHMRTVNTATMWPQYAGTAWETVIAVEWAWMTLPLSVVILSVVILGWTILRTERLGTIAWKNSGLMLAWCRVDDSLIQLADADADALRKPQVLDELVSKTPVYLACDEEGENWTFKPSVL
jgi:hypothetical protein